jgi:hypothetical protein
MCPVSVWEPYLVGKLAGMGVCKGHRREESREEGEAYLDGVDPSEMQWRWSTRWRTIVAWRSRDGGGASAGFHAWPEEAEISLPVETGDTVTVAMGFQMESKQKRV